MHTCNYYLYKPMIYQNFLAQRPKSDIIFYRAFKELHSKCQAFAIFKGLLSCALIALLVLNIMDDNPRAELIQLIIACIITSIFGFATKIYKAGYVYSKPIILLALAEAKGHTVADQTTNNFYSMEACVSERVFIANTGINEADIDDVTKKTYLNASIRAIQLEVPVIFRGIASCQRLHSLMSVTTLLYAIAELCDPSINKMNQVSLAIYVSLVGLSEILFIIVLLIVCLIPLFCIVFLFYYCCCRQHRGNFMNVSQRKANMIDIMNVDGNCSICYQNIGQNEIIYELPCSAKHIFHKGCLQNWIKIKQTCPICRAEIPMTDRPPQP